MVDFLFFAKIWTLNSEISLPTQLFRQEVSQWKEFSIGKHFLRAVVARRAFQVWIRLENAWNRFLALFGSISNDNRSFRSPELFVSNFLSRTLLLANVSSLVWTYMMLRYPYDCERSSQSRWFQRSSCFEHQNTGNHDKSSQNARKIDSEHFWG